jgi:hypothetical protein
VRGRRGRGKTKRQGNKRRKETKGYINRTKGEGEIRKEEKEKQRRIYSKS